MLVKMYKLYCEVCSWKKDVESLEGFNKFTFPDVQSKIPVLEDGKIKQTPFKTRKEKIKCPNCGRLVKINGKNITPRNKASLNGPPV